MSEKCGWGITLTNVCVCVCRDRYGGSGSDSDGESEEKRKRKLDQFIESEFRKRRRVSSIPTHTHTHTHTHLPHLCLYRLTQIQQKILNHQVHPCTHTYCKNLIMYHTLSLYIQSCITHTFESHLLCLVIVIYQPWFIYFFSGPDCLLKEASNVKKVPKLTIKVTHTYTVHYTVTTIH